VCGIALGGVQQCGSAAVCGSVRQCVAVRAALCGSEWQCVAVRVALCGGSALYAYIYTKLLTIYIVDIAIPLYKKENKIKYKTNATNPLGEPYEHRVRVIKIKLN
jgi:hypothetical protein